MGYKKHTNTTIITDLVSTYEAMSQSGTLALLGEKVFLQLIDYYEQEFLLERALEIADQGIEHHAFSAELHLRKAALLLHARQEDDALILLDKAEALSPADLKISLLRAEVFAHLGMHATALEMLEILKDFAIGEELGAIYQVESIVHEQQEQQELMFFALKAALTYDPTNEQALERMWVCVELTKKYEESVALYNELLEKDAYSHLAWYNLAHAYAYLCQYDEAIEAYEFAFLINEAFEVAYRDYAEICFELHRYQEAIPVYEALLEKFELDSEPLLRLGQCYWKTGNIARARHYLHQTAQLDTLNEEVFFSLGEIYAGEENWQKAISFYKKAIDIEYCREEYFLALAKAHWQLGDLAEAEFYFQEATQTAPENIQCWYQYGCFLLRLEEKEAALDLLEDAVELMDESELEYCYIAWLLQAGERKAALNLLTASLQAEPEHYTILFEFMPELEQDREVQAVISLFQ